jgi:hypothetical protein
MGPPPDEIMLAGEERGRGGSSRIGGRPAMSPRVDCPKEISGEGVIVHAT